MKKLFSIILAAAILAVAGSDALAQNQKALNKALKKEYKTKMKEYSNGGWTLFGSSRTLDVMLLKHYEKLNQEDVTEVVGIASAFQSKSVGHQVAINDACRTYSQNAGSHVKGRIVSDLGNDSEDVKAEFEHFYAAYERNVEAEIKGELQESYCVIRQIDKKAGKPVYEMQAFFCVDAEAASAARIRAFENALKESEAAQKYADKVSEFIKEGFVVE